MAGLRRWALVVALVVAGCGSASSPPADRGDARAAHACGLERWAVKVGTDAAARAVSLTPRLNSVAALTAVPAPREPSARTAGVEEHVYRVGVSVVAVKEEADSDYHLELSDGSRTMIAEAPDPACAAGSRFAARIAAVRAELNRVCPAIPTAAYRRVSLSGELVGVGFFDRIHGQRGVAPNGVELHPLLAVRLRGKC